MSRSGAKQGNRKHRTKVRVYDPESETLKLVKDEQGRPKTIGIPTPVSDATLERWARERAEWAEKRRAKDSIARIEAEAEMVQAGVLQE